MTEQRDTNLGLALMGLPVPPDSPDFWERLTLELEDVAGEQTGGDVVPLIEFDSRAEREGPGRRSMGTLLLVAATVLVVAGLGLFLLTSRGSDGTTTDPVGEGVPSTDGRTAEEKAQFEAQVRNLGYLAWDGPDPVVLSDGRATVDVSTRGDVDSVEIELTHYLPGDTGPYAAVILTTTVDQTESTANIYLVGPEDPESYLPGDPLVSTFPSMLTNHGPEVRTWEVTVDTVAISYLDSSGASVTENYQVKRGGADRGALFPLLETTGGPFSDDLISEFNTSVLNLTYSSEWSDSGEITLVDGEWIGPPADGEGSTQTRVSIWSQPEGASAATNSDGGMTSFSQVVLVTDPGGSGTFYDFYLVVPVGGGFYKSGDELVAIGPVPLGDRIEIESLDASPLGMHVRLVDSQGVSRSRSYDFDGEKFVRVNLPTWLGGPVPETDLACWDVTNSGLLDQYAPVEPIDGRLIACDERDLDALLAERPEASVLDLIDALVIAKISE